MSGWISLFALLLALVPGPLLQAASSATEPSSTLDLESGWQYRWGDSPMTPEGVPLWSIEPGDEYWQDLDFPANPPGRNGQTNVWYRVTLPEGEWRDPVVYILSADLIVEAYLDGQRLYRHGTFDEQGHGHFAGWPWHMIPLPANSGGKVLYFRVFSDYLDIGFWGEIKVMERLALFKYIISNSIEGFVIGGLSGFLALLSLVFAALQKERRIFIATALYALGSGAVVVGKCPANQLLVNLPMLWDVVGALGYFILPVAMGLLLEQWFEQRRRRLYRGVWRFFLVFFMLASLLLVPGLVPVTRIYPIFDVLFAVGLTLLFIPTLCNLRQYNGEQKAILACFGILGILLVIDMAVAHDFVPWIRVPVSWGSFAFLLTIIGISLRYFARAQRDLAELNRSLEHQVRVRTRELERLSYEDPLTGLKNRRFFNDVLEREIARATRERSPLSLLICDLDEFKRFNDSHGHAAGDEALRHVSRVLSSVFRRSDLICRHGGEEFVILLPGSSEIDALRKAEVLRRTVSAEPVYFEQEALGSITLSVGVATWCEQTEDGAALLEAADRALYQAKRSGRDQVALAGGGVVNPT